MSKADYRDLLFNKDYHETIRIPITLEAEDYIETIQSMEADQLFEDFDNFCQLYEGLPEQCFQKDILMLPPDLNVKLLDIFNFIGEEKPLTSLKDRRAKANEKLESPKAVIKKEKPMAPHQYLKRIITALTTKKQKIVKYKTPNAPSRYKTEKITAKNESPNCPTLNRKKQNLVKMCFLDYLDKSDIVSRKRIKYVDNSLRDMVNKKYVNSYRELGKSQGTNSVFKVHKTLLLIEDGCISSREKLDNNGQIVTEKDLSRSL